MLKINTNNYKFPMFMLGAILSTAFAPLFFVPSLLALSFFAYYLKGLTSKLDAFKYGMLFGFGFFVTSLYWLAIGVSVYIEEFWWAIPLAVTILPMFLSLFWGIFAVTGWCFRSKEYYPFYLSVIWVFLEWVRGWIFSGFPWNLVAYTISFSEILIQISSVVGPYGISFIICYIMFGAYELFDEKKHLAYFITTLTIICIWFCYGEYRLRHNPTKYTNILVRLVQPSIQQTDKWEADKFYQNLHKHINYSIAATEKVPDITIWSEAALTVSHKVDYIKDAIREAVLHKDGALVFGGVYSELLRGEEYNLYTSMIAVNSEGDDLFLYHKSHLVPFGEYIPLRRFLPFKKLTAGLQDYSRGKFAEVAKLNDLIIRPLICYEAVFPDEVRGVPADVMFNITNDAWYGNSSGPYQHFYNVRFRAVENGIPLIRVANNGISSIIDSYGRIVGKTALNQNTILDGYIPDKVNNFTSYFRYGNSLAMALIVLIYMIRKIFDLFIVFF